MMGFQYFTHATKTPGDMAFLISNMMTPHGIDNVVAATTNSPRFVLPRPRNVSDSLQAASELE